MNRHCDTLCESETKKIDMRSMTPPSKRARTEMSPGLLAARKSFRTACRLMFLPEEEQGPAWSADVLALLAAAGAVADDCARADDAIVPGRRTLKNPRWISALTHIDAASLLQSGGKGSRARARREYAAALESHAESIEAHAGLARLIRLDASDGAAMAALDAHLSAAVRLGLTIDFDAIAESTSSATIAIHERERDAFLAAREALSLLRCQTAGRADDAAEHLLAQGFEYRLSTEVFSYSLTPLAVLDAAAAQAQRAPLRVLNDALPSPLLSGLRVALGDASPFWKEHSYSGLGGEYFSYLHDLSAVLANPNRTVIDQAMKHVYGLAQSCFPDIALGEGGCFACVLLCTPVAYYFVRTPLPFSQFGSLLPRHQIPLFILPFQTKRGTVSGGLTTAHTRAATSSTLTATSRSSSAATAKLEQ